MLATGEVSPESTEHLEASPMQPLGNMATETCLYVGPNLPSTDTIYQRDKGKQWHLQNTIVNGIQVHEFPYTHGVSIIPSPRDGHYTRQLKIAAFFIGVVHSLQSSLVALSSSLTAGEDLLRGLITDGVE
jgi:hypothetical protein